MIVCHCPRVEAASDPRYFGDLLVNRLTLTGLTIALCMASASIQADGSVSVPDEVKTLFVASDTVLAVKASSHSSADAGTTAVVVRHAVEDGQRKNPCELVVLRKDKGRFVVSERNDKIVECIYNESAKTAGTLGLDHNLTVTPTEISYFNELARGGTTYTFTWSNDKTQWHLQHVDASSVQNEGGGVVVYKSVLDYPSQLSWIPLTDFDPKLIRESVSKNRKVVK